MQMAIEAEHREELRASDRVLRDAAVNWKGVWQQPE